MLAAPSVTSNDCILPCAANYNKFVKKAPLLVMAKCRSGGPLIPIAGILGNRPDDRKRPLALVLGYLWAGIRKFLLQFRRTRVDLALSDLSGGRP